MDRCESCRHITTCPVCGASVRRFHHVGVRGTRSTFKIPVLDVKISHESQPSGVWHYTDTCQHRVYPLAPSVATKYNGGPLWKAGYSWQNVYWGTYYAKPSRSSWIKRVETATAHIESDKNYSGGLAQYNVGIGKFTNPATINQDPPSQISNDQIKKVLTEWINAGTVADLGTQGAYNIFMPPSTTISLSADLSCQTFCDFHDSVDGPNGPFYTVEPFPCASGCNQCSSNPFDTLTQGLSEEMVELKTDMDPGSGWVIGNEEVCDFCDANFVCNKISTGEYVNAWYDKGKSACWKGV